MTSKTTPNSHPERDKAISAITSYKTSEGPNPLIVGIMASVIDTPMSSYVLTYSAFQGSKANQRKSAEAVDVADVGFDKPLRIWVRTVNDDDGKSLSKELTKLMGGTTAGELPLLSPRKEVTKAKLLFANLANNPRLMGDATKLEAVKAAVAILEPLVDAEEDAERDLSSKGRELTKSIIDFDKSYSKLWRSVAGVIGDKETAKILPRFPRKKKKSPED